MAFRTNDFKKTTRKAKGDQPAALYPHQLRDKKTLARLDIAIRLFDQMVGKRRGEMDAATLVDFFGDPRLARGIVACLGQYYQYRARTFPELVGAEAANCLKQSGLTSPMQVRARTYAHLNTHAQGFVTEEGRPHVYAQIASEWNLSGRDWDTLMHADTEDNQTLFRPGPIPAAADIAALYNFHALDTALHRAQSVTLTNLTLTPAQATDTRRAAELLGTKAVVSQAEQTVTLTPNPVDTDGKRQTSHLARTVLLLTHAHATRATSGHIHTTIGTKPYQVALSTDTFRALGCPLAQKNSASVAPRLGATNTLHHDLLKLRAKGLADNWRIKRLPAPRVSATGVLLPDLALTLNAQTVLVSFADYAPQPTDPPIVVVPLTRTQPNAEHILARASGTLNTLFTPDILPTPDVPSDVRTLCDRAATQGLVRAADAQRTLHLLDEEPLIAWLKQSPDPRVRYIPGLGLCAETMISTIREG